MVEFPEVACYHNLVQQELALYGIGLGNEEFLFRGKYLFQHMHTGCGKTAHIETFQYVHCVVAFLWRESLRQHHVIVENLPQSNAFAEKVTVYMNEYKDAIYCIGSALGPHPFPKMVRDFQSIIGIEAREQFTEMTGHLPDAICACVGGGSNSLGMFTPFLADPVEIYGIEPLGRGSNVGDHAATMAYGTKGRIHGFDTYLLQDENGDPLPVYSIASGLDYPGVGPEHSFLRDQGRVHYETISDDEAMEAFFLLSRYEGIIPAIESSHALAYAIKYAKENQYGEILACLSGRGDKDIDYVYENYGCGEKFNLGK